MDYDRADLQADLIDDLREEIEVLKKKIGDHAGINDIFLSIKDAAKVLKKWQYQELTVTDQETGQEFKVYTVNKETIDEVSALREKIKEHLTYTEVKYGVADSLLKEYLEMLGKNAP